MRKVSVIFIIALFFIFPALQYRKQAISQDCFVQIISITLNRSSHAIGETLQVNITYDLYYDQQDPLGAGSTSITIEPMDGGEPIQTTEYLDIGINVEKTLLVEIYPQDWSPNETSQQGEIIVQAWVQDSSRTMTDNAIREFQVVQSAIEFVIEQNPLNYAFHDTVTITGTLLNPHNTSLPLSYHPINISVSNPISLIQTWRQNTTQNGLFYQTINTSLIGIGSFICDIFSEPDDDYLISSSQLTLARRNLAR